MSHHPERTARNVRPVNQPPSKYYGVELVGNSVKDDKGILSGFANMSYAKIKAPFDPKDKKVEVIVEFETGEQVDNCAGLLTTVGKCGFTPLFVLNNQVVGYLSSNGSTWDITNGTPIGLPLKPKTVCCVKMLRSEKSFAWYLNENGRWLSLAEIHCITPIYSTDVQFGTGQRNNYPFSGTVNLNKSYIMIGGKLWWEGVKGAYKKCKQVI